MKEFWKQVFSEKGVPSSKRVAGMFTIVVACVIIAILSIKAGCTDCVRNLLQTLVISGMALLGLSTVTNVFKK